MIERNYQDLPDEARGLIDSAIEACRNAYNPYSGFSVGAAILTRNGDIITGANIENAAYGSTICAERSALAAANAQNLRNLKCIAISAYGPTGPDENIASPCGACRQMLFEACQVSGSELEVILASSNRSKVIVTSISELLPLGFGPAQLGIDIKPYRNP